MCLILSMFLQSYQRINFMMLDYDRFMFVAENMVFIYFSVFRFQAHKAIFLWDMYN